MVETMGDAVSHGDAKTDRPAKSSHAFRTISEVAEELNVAQHVLRFWESKFPQVRPLKRGGGRRYYRPEDIDVLRQIRALLYDEGYTIKGAQRHLRGRRSRTADETGDAQSRPARERRAPRPQPTPSVTAEPGADDHWRVRLSEIREDLESIKGILEEARAGLH